MPILCLQSEAEAAEAPGSSVSTAAAGPAPEPGPAPGIPAAGGSHGNHRLGEHLEDGSIFLYDLVMGVCCCYAGISWYVLELEANPIRVCISACGIDRSEVPQIQQML